MLKFVNVLTKISFLFLFLNATLFGQWVYTQGPGGGLDAKDLHIDGSNLFAATEVGVYQFNGTSWNIIKYYQESNNISSGNTLYSNFSWTGNNVLWANDYGVWKSNDNGITWDTLNTGLPYNAFVSAIMDLGNGIFLASAGKGIYRSSNYGGSWSRALALSSNAYDFAINGSTIFAGFNNAGIYISNDQGQTWSATSNTGLSSLSIYNLIVHNSNIYAGTNIGVFKSTNNGQSWTNVTNGLPISVIDVHSYPKAFSIINGKLIISLRSKGAYYTNDDGQSWTALDLNSTLSNYPLSTMDIGKLFATSNTVYLCSSGGVFVRPLSELSGLTDVENTNKITPNKFSLQQNYPNPFNPSTIISYTIPSESKVVISVYNLLGQKVADLFNATESTGYHEINFDASNLASGIYLYRITAESTNSKKEFSDTKKLLLLK